MSDDVIETTEQANEPAEDKTTLLDNTQEESTQEEAQEVKEGEKAEEQEIEKKAPESYEFSDTDSIDKDVLESFSNIAKEVDLSQEEASKILDTVGPKFMEAQKKQIEATKNAWAEESKNDSEIGGEKFYENLAIAKKAIDSFANEGLMNILNQTGLGNNPDVIKMFYNIGKSISEDSYVGNGEGNKLKQKSMSELMYDKT